MILFWLLFVSLVLGGVAVSLWYDNRRRIPWLRVARVPVPVHRPVCQRNPGRPRSGGCRDTLLPLPRVVTRAGPQPHPLP
jgi:hypothetical protein